MTTVYKLVNSIDAFKTSPLREGYLIVKPVFDFLEMSFCDFFGNYNFCDFPKNIILINNIILDIIILDISLGNISWLKLQLIL
jgi:hypothetical protein